MTPEDLLNFWELNWFASSWQEQKLSDDDLTELQLAIMRDPKAGAVMQGTNGLRKLRFSPTAWKTGKSSALRVCYVYFEKYGLVLLCLAFRKGDLDNLSAAGKQAVNAAIERISSLLLERYGF